MIKFNFNQTGGFKIITQVLARIQDAYSIINGVASMAGSMAILSGCEVNGTNVSDGTVVINGETLDFVGGILQSTVIIKEEITNATFKDGSVKPVETYRYATFGFSETALQWSDFKRVFPLQNLNQKFTELQTNIDAVNSSLTAYQEAVGLLRKGSILIGDIQGKSIGWSYTGIGYSISLINKNKGSEIGGDDLYRVVLTTPLPDINYVVFTSVNYTGSYIQNNDVITSITNKSVNGFDISIREVGTDVQSVTLDYSIFQK